jgi:hypothetical protein
MDFDDANACEIAPEALAQSFAFLEEQQDRAACFAVQEGILYDVYALRHPLYSPDDCWEMVNARPPWMSYHHAMHRYVGVRQKKFPRKVVTEVASAFGGIGIYKTSFLIAGTYRGRRTDGAETCEHVELHYDIRSRGGRLWVVPWLQNDAPPEHVIGKPTVLDRLRVIRQLFKSKLVIP